MTRAVGRTWLVALLTACRSGEGCSPEQSTSSGTQIQDPCDSQWLAITLSDGESAFEEGQPLPFVLGPDSRWQARVGVDIRHSPSLVWVEPTLSRTDTGETLTTGLAKAVQPSLDAACESTLDDLLIQLEEVVSDTAAPGDGLACELSGLSLQLSMFVQDVVYPSRWATAQAGVVAHFEGVSCGL